MPRGRVRPASETLGAPSDEADAKKALRIRRDRGGALRGAHTVMLSSEVLGDKHAARNAVQQRMGIEEETPRWPCSEPLERRERTMRRATCGSHGVGASADAPAADWMAAPWGGRAVGSSLPVTPARVSWRERSAKPRRPHRDVHATCHALGRGRETPARCLPGRAGSKAARAPRGGATARWTGVRTQTTGRFGDTAAREERSHRLSGGLGRLRSAKTHAGLRRSSDRHHAARVTGCVGDGGRDASDWEAQERNGCGVTGNRHGAQRTHEWRNASRLSLRSASNSEGASACGDVGHGYLARGKL